MFSFEEVFIPLWVERIGIAGDEFVADNSEGRKHTHENNFPIAEFAKKLPLAVANTHKQEGNDVTISQIVMSSSCPVPDVAPENAVKFIECSLGAGMPVKVCPSGNHRV